MNTKNQLKPTYSNYNGFLLPKDFSHDAFESILSYEAEATDTFIATYPKCGTTWTQYIVWLLAHNGEALPGEKTMAVEIPHIEEEGKSKILTLPSPRFLKTHLPFSLTPYHPDAKYIYVARNPFDCVVSFYHHTRGFVKHYDFAEGTFESFFECFILGEVDFGDYFDNLLSWYEHKDDRNVLFLTYEGLKLEPRQKIIIIAQFLGDKYSEKVENPEILNKILEQSDFINMSKNQNRWCSKRPENMPPFIRKGIVGDWKNYFSQRQIERLSDKFIARTKGTEIAKFWQNNFPFKFD